MGSLTLRQGQDPAFGKWVKRSEDGNFHGYVMGISWITTGIYIYIHIIRGFSRDQVTFLR